MKEYVVVLAGGKGERFWPASRATHPKQLIKLISERTMIRETIERTLPIVPLENTFIVPSAEIAELITQSYPEISSANFIIEPVGKNTAPAICLAAANIVARFGDGVMYVLASDHFINPTNMFREALQVSSEIVKTKDRLVLMGIQPTRAETGYGYIHVGDKIAEYGGIRGYNVKAFKEKPSRVKAQEFYLSSDYLWNSGNFMFRAGKILEEADKHIPRFAAEIKKYIANFGTSKADEILKNAFENVEGISIDYAIFEKSGDVAVLWGAFQWDDVGSWSALERVLPKDKFNNVAVGKSDNCLVETYDTTVYGDNEGLVVTLGVSDLVIVRMKDVVLVMNKTRVSGMRELVNSIKENPEWKKYL